MNQKTEKLVILLPYSSFKRFIPQNIAFTNIHYGSNPTRETSGI